MEWQQFQLCGRKKEITWNISLALSLEGCSILLKTVCQKHRFALRPFALLDPDGKCSPSIGTDLSACLRRTKAPQIFKILLIFMIIMMIMLDPDGKLANCPAVFLQNFSIWICYNWAKQVSWVGQLTSGKWFHSMAYICQDVWEGPRSFLNDCNQGSTNCGILPSRKINHIL